MFSFYLIISPRSPLVSDSEESDTEPEGKNSSRQHVLDTFAGSSYEEPMLRDAN